MGGGGGEGWKGKIPKGTGVGWGLDDGLEQKIRSSWDVPSSSINLNPNPKPNPKTTCIYNPTPNASTNLITSPQNPTSKTGLAHYT